MKNKEENVINFYCLCNKLKDTIRTGWLDWNVKRERVESIAEHIFGVQMLAIAMWSEYNYNLDIKKVILMLAIHETEEILIGDLTPFDIDRETKRIIGQKAVCEVLKNLNKKDEIIEIINEFEERKTNEAKFAFYCDKLECDLQCKLYDEQNCVDINDSKNLEVAKNEDVNNLLKENKSWSNLWICYSKNNFDYDENFLKVANHISKNKILNNK